MTSAETIASSAPAPRGRSLVALWPVALGIWFGLCILYAAGMPLRWSMYFAGGMIFTTLLLASSDPHRLLTTVFLLGLQAEVSLRIAYGHAGTGGLSFPLPFLAGMGLVGWEIVSRDATAARYHWAGRLGLPILCLFATSFLSEITTSERFAGLVRLLFEFELYFIYFVGLNMVRSERDLDRVVRLLFLTLAIQSVIYFLQVGLGATFTLSGEFIDRGDTLPRPGGTVSTNPAGYASFIMPILLLAVAYFFNEDDRRASRYEGILIVLGMGALCLTFTRAAWSAFVFGVLWLLWFGSKQREFKSRRARFVVIAGIVVTVLALPLIVLRLSESPVAEAYDERWGLMRIAFEMIKAHPLTGVGTGAYPYVYRGYLPNDLPDQWLHPVHNEYLLRSAETGIVGGAVFIWLLISAVRLSVGLARSENRRIRMTALGWGAGLIALMWEMYWDIWRGFSYNASLWFTMGLMEAANRIYGPARSENRRLAARPTAEGRRR